MEPTGSTSTGAVLPVSSPTPLQATDPRRSDHWLRANRQLSPSPDSRDSPPVSRPLLSIFRHRIGVTRPLVGAVTPLSLSAVRRDRGQRHAERVSSVAKFRKLGGKVILTEKTYTSSKNRNCIRYMVVSLSNHSQSNNSISFKGKYAKQQKNDTYCHVFF